MRKPMGRPPLGLEMTMIRLPKGTGKLTTPSCSGEGEAERLYPVRLSNRNFGAARN